MGRQKGGERRGYRRERDEKEKERTLFPFVKDLKKNTHTQSHNLGVGFQATVITGAAHSTSQGTCKARIK